MKKIIEISGENNALILEHEVSSPSTFIKVYNSRKRLIRHSRSSGRFFQFTAPQGKYIIETDGKIKSIKEDKKDLTQNLKKLYRYLEIDLPNNMLTLNGIPFYQTDDLGSFINRMVKDKKELQGYLETHYEKIAQKERKKLLSDEKVIEVLAGGGTAAEKTKIKKGLLDFNKERKRINATILKAKNANEMLNIVPKFPKSILTEIKVTNKKIAVKKPITKTKIQRKP